MKKELYKKSVGRIKKMAIETHAGAILSKEDISIAIDKFLRCDWGDVTPENWLKNDEAYKAGGKLEAIYTSTNGYQLYVVLNPDEKIMFIRLAFASGEQERMAA